MKPCLLAGGKLESVLWETPNKFSTQSWLQPRFHWTISLGNGVLLQRSKTWALRLSPYSLKIHKVYKVYNMPLLLPRSLSLRRTIRLSYQETVWKVFIIYDYYGISKELVPIFSLSLRSSSGLIYLFIRWSSWHLFIYLSIVHKKY